MVDEDREDVLEDLRGSFNVQHELEAENSGVLEPQVLQKHAASDAILRDNSENAAKVTDLHGPEKSPEDALPAAGLERIIVAEVFADLAGQTKYNNKTSQGIGVEASLQKARLPRAPPQHLL